MLITTRRPGQEVVIDENTAIVILGIQGNKVRLGITAPQESRVDRTDDFGRKLDEVELLEVARAG